MSIPFWKIRREMSSHGKFVENKELMGAGRIKEASGTPIV
jgi:hypothetical protein